VTQKFSQDIKNPRTDSISMWNATINREWQEFQRGALPYVNYPMKYTHWPYPNPNYVRSIHLLACEHTWQARITMWRRGAVLFFYQNLIPSPVELTRKFVLGGYKCGFYIPVAVRSPIDQIWRDGTLSKTLAEISGPLTRGLFYWWAAETAWSALNMWSSLIHEGEVCNPDGTECLLRDGNGTWPGVPAHRIGSPGLFTEIYDPRGRYSFGGSHIDIFEASHVSASAFGRLQPFQCTFDNVEVWIRHEGIDGPKTYIGHVGAGEIVSFDCSWGGEMGIGVVSVMCELDITGNSLFAPSIWCDRFTVKAVPPEPGSTDGPLWPPEEPQEPCDELYQAMYSGEL